LFDPVSMGRRAARRVLYWWPGRRRRSPPAWRQGRPRTSRAAPRRRPWAAAGRSVQRGV